MRTLTVPVLLLAVLAIGCGEPTVAPTESTIGAPKLSGHTGVTETVLGASQQVALKSP